MISALIVSLVVGAAPVIPPAAKWVPPGVQTRKLASGAQLWVVPQKGVPLVHVGVLLNAGALYDPKGKSGLATLTAMEIEEGGSGNRSGDEVRAFFDSLGTVLNFAAQDDGVLVSVTVLSSKFEAALGGVADVITKPRFDATAFQSLKQRQKSEIAVSLDDAVTFADQKLAEALYGEGPRGNLDFGTVAGVEATTLDDVKAHHANFWSPANTLFVLVGDVDPDAAKRSLDGVLPKAWSNGAAAPIVAAPKEVAANTPWLAFDKPAAAQTVVRFARHAMPAKDPSRTSLELVSTVLGGSFTSRLVQNLREKHGYTYGATSAVGGGRETMSLELRTSVKTEVTAPALIELINELKGITKIDPADLTKARALRDADQIQAYGSGEGTLLTLLSLASEGRLPTDAAEDRLRREKATLAELTTASARFDPAGFVVVLVGDRAKIEKELKAKFPDRTIEWR